MVPKGNVSVIMHMHKPKTSAENTVRRSKFFSQIPEPAVELYIEDAIMSDTPVPLPECISMRITVKNPESARITSNTELMGPTWRSFVKACVRVHEMPMANFSTP